MKWLRWIVAAIPAMALPAHAGPPVAVTNYSWLQIPDGIIAFAGTPSSPFSTNGFTGHLSMEHFRWGGPVWIPDGASTAFGTNDYWGGLQLDEPRNVKSIRLQYWANENTRVRRLRLEGSADATNFVSIGFHDFGSYTTGGGSLNLSVTDGVYRVVRVRMNGEGSQPGDADYLCSTSNPTGRGGPGFQLIEPFGDGSIVEYRVNWVNSAHFTTLPSRSGTNLNFWEGSGTPLNSGTLEDGARVGDIIPWDPGSFFQIDLGTNRSVFRSILVSDDNWGATSAAFQYSTNGTTFTSVSGLSAPIYRATAAHGALEYTFAPADARYWRVTGASGSSYALFNQWMLYASANQAPVAICKDATVVVGVNGGTLQTADVDDGSYDPDLDPITLSLSRDSFGYGDLGVTNVMLIVQDSLTQGSCLANVTVILDPALNGRIPVNNYSWLQLRPNNVTALIGSSSGSGGSANGSPNDFRWGNPVWIADSNFTGAGSATYWAALKLDEPHEVENVWVQWWLSEGTAISNFFVDVSGDGSSWTQVGSYDYGAMISNQQPRTDVNVTDATGLYVRVRLEPGGYRGVQAHRGGPGILTIEPMGDGALNVTNVNWANVTNFLTAVSNNNLGFNGLRYNDGLLYEDDGIRTGETATWSVGDFAQVDLKAKRYVDTIVVVWDSYYAASSLTVQWSADGTSFANVPNQTGPVGFSGAHQYTFDWVKARYIRVSDLVGAPYALLNQIVVLGAPTPPPAGTLIMVK